MEELIEQLKVILGTNFALYLKSHNYHWNIEGNNFPQYHDFLDGFYNEVFAQNDPIAEHIRYLDAYAPGSFTRFLELSVVDEATTVPDPLTMMITLKNDNDRYIIQLRAGIILAEQAGEPAVGNFLQDLLGAHQKKAWMLRSIIK
jgi:starvation-inducible DNA-binding protein